MATLSKLVGVSVAALIATVAQAQSATPQGDVKAPAAQAAPADPAKAPALGSGTKADAKADPAFKKADANGDGKLSSSEASKVPGLAGKFAELDKDGDGSISADEYAAAAPKN